ncbi:MAG: hypothetical protein GFH27_549285n342 [Chloroflexi bacterium AL-W]|nr:hypothetical protein [Chloroflexi bacterium AL-N1]NOK65853.1 hypothetical protein [Chloroflexi bacterium AL-N10]NOK74206.1 hypothetical protein [Chloroflexi bacterium AL-N5]NOK80886.1 hypothetical protein [Chloroflexi bacterium AL-W]NOK88464.1 hypothetical protein [Chloroflexi bacterium AL-N15]
MKSVLTEDFLVHFRNLPDAVKEVARKNYRLWRENPRHPSLQFKRVHQTELIYSVRVGLGWRALGLLEDDTIAWFWIGSHADYNHLIK